jgi:hypothetical protein
VGVQRSGTTWWFELLAAHPDVTATRKEIGFFDAFYARELGIADIEAYHRLFPRPPGGLAGEWTPRYMHDFWTPALLRKAAPEARLLVMLRDPLARFESGLSRETISVERAVLRTIGDYVRAMLTGDALSRSLYAEQVSRLLDHFDRSQVLILQYERCVGDPRAELRRTYDFLGLEPPGSLPAELEHTIGKLHPRLPLPEDVRREARRRMAEDARKLTEIVPEIDLALWPSCRSS